MAPPESTAERVTGALATADLAHLACHGTLRADNPMFSSLLLSDGPLTVQELYARGLAPHRLILASCESGAHVSYAATRYSGSSARCSPAAPPGCWRARPWCPTWPRRAS